jgi:anti-sigma B factor antagonist
MTRGSMPRTGDRSEPELLRIEVTNEVGTAALKVAGELDLTTRDYLWAKVEDALGSRPELIIIDASGLVFLDSSGFAALLRARAWARDAGVAFRVTEPSPALCRVADVGGVGDEFLSDW